MAVTVEVPEGKQLTVEGPAKVVVTVDPGAGEQVKLDDVPVIPPDPPPEAK
jgi:hypothetical protein